MSEGSAYAAAAVAALATYLWRGLGALLAGRIAPDRPALDWVGCVAYGLLAALIARMILLPTGPLAEAALTARGAAVLVGVGAFFVFRRNVLAGVAAGGATLSVLQYL